MRYLIIFTAILTLAIGTEAYPVILTQLTTDTENNSEPSWSPDGSSIAYVSSQDIWVIPATGVTSTQLTTYSGRDDGPDYSPDGSKILYSTTMSSQVLGIWSVFSTGGSPTRIFDSHGNDYNAQWSPDGTRIVFETEMWVSGPGGQNIGIISSDGSSLTRLTYGNYGDYHPTWSPDGDTILFHSYYRSGNEDLWTVPVAGGTPVNLTNTPDRSEMFGAYSPDGQWIALEIEIGGIHGLWVMPAAGGDPILIIDDVGHGCMPSWSPDGTMIAFARTGEDSQMDIWIASDLPYPINPIPEPSTILLLTTGLSGMVAYGFRRRKKV